MHGTAIVKPPERLRHADVLHGAHQLARVGHCGGRDTRVGHQPPGAGVRRHQVTGVPCTVYLIFNVPPGFSGLSAANRAAATSTPVVSPLIALVSRPAPRMVAAVLPPVNTAGSSLLLMVCALALPLGVHACRVLSV